jgi:hypothetical protein
VKDCQVCGRSFDPLAFQVVVPELGRGFDRLECAHTARATALPGSTVAVAPLVAVVEPLAAAAAVPAAAGAAAVSILRLGGIPVATLGLLAAGTVTAVYLWLGVLGVEPTSFPLSRGFIPSATHRETVQAHVQIAPARTPATISAPAEGRRPATVALLAAAGGSFSSTGTRRPASHSGASGPTRHVLGRGDEPPHGKAKGKGHAKHGKGHFKHGESDGMHSAGHGGSSATSAKHGGGKGHGRGKRH